MNDDNWGDIPIDYESDRIPLNPDKVWCEGGNNCRCNEPTEVTEAEQDPREKAFDEGYAEGFEAAKAEALIEIVKAVINL